MRDELMVGKSCKAWISSLTPEVDGGTLEIKIMALFSEVTQELGGSGIVDLINLVNIPVEICFKRKEVKGEIDIELETAQKEME